MQCGELRRSDTSSCMKWFRELKIPQNSGRTCTIGDIDTTASLLSFTWFAIAKKPDVLENSRVENDDLSGEKPSFPALQDMRYLKALLDECRLTMTLLTLLETA